MNGRKVEQEYIRVYGLQNAVHIIMRRPVKALFDYILNTLKVPFEEIDNEGLNPIYIGIKTRMDVGKPTLSISSKILIDKGADFDLADR